MSDAKEDMLAVVALSVKAAAMGSALIDSRRTVDELREQVFIGLRKIATLSRERDAERAVVAAAKALCDVINPPKMESYTDYKAAADVFIAAVTALRALEERDA